MNPARRRWLARWAAVACGLVLLADLGAPPDRQLSARFLIAAIHLYQATLSPAMPRLGVRCRFQPSCSHYAEGVIRKYGALVGAGKAAWRVMRCGPWTPAGTVDPP